MFEKARLRLNHTSSTLKSYHALKQSVLIEAYKKRMKCTKRTKRKKHAKRTLGFVLLYLLLFFFPCFIAYSVFRGAEHPILDT